MSEELANLRCDLLTAVADMEAPRLVGPITDELEMRAHPRSIEQALARYRQEQSKAAGLPHVISNKPTICRRSGQLQPGPAAGDGWTPATSNRTHCLCRRGAAFPLCFGVLRPGVSLTGPGSC
jgi:hypothetical protein